MSFIDTLKKNYAKLPKSSIVTQLWAGLQSKDMHQINISTEDLIEYSFHFPVDIDRYLLSLNTQFDELNKTELLEIDGNLKGYLMTFLYYFLSPCFNVKLSKKAIYYSAQLYLKVMLLPEDIAEYYFEMKLFILLATTINNFIEKRNTIEQPMLAILELLYEIVSERKVYFGTTKGVCNFFSNCISCSVIPECGSTPAIADFCSQNLRNLLKKRPTDEVRHCILNCLIRHLSKKRRRESHEAHVKNIIKLHKAILQDIILNNNKDNNELIADLINMLFQLLGDEGFDLFEDCVDILNMLNGADYRTFGYKLTRYLETRNHDRYVVNMLQLIGTMIQNPYPTEEEKRNAMYTLYFRDVILYLLHNDTQLQETAVNTMAKICSITDSEAVENIFYKADRTGRFLTLEAPVVIEVMNKIMLKYTGNLAMAKNILMIFTKMARSLHLRCSNSASELLLTMFKNSTPFGIKNLLKELHELYLRLYQAREIDLAKIIMMILLKMALNQDMSSSIFIEHLYYSSVFPSYIGKEKFTPEYYSDVLFHDEFEYFLLMAKCKHLMTYDHVVTVLASINYNNGGPSALLCELLREIPCKDYSTLIKYITDNLDHVARKRSGGPLIKAFRMIVNYNERFPDADVRRLRTMHLLLWEGLNKGLCSCFNIEHIIELIKILSSIIRSNDDERKKNLIIIASRAASKALIDEDYCQGSIVQLTEICVALETPPTPEALVLFDKTVDDHSKIALMKEQNPSIFIQLVSFYGTLSMMKKSEAERAVRLFNEVLDTDNPTLQLMTLKTYYHLCKHLTKEFTIVLDYCFSKISSTHQVLCRTCLSILEDMAYEGYITFTSEQYYKFMYRLGSFGMSEFLKNILEKRYILSNKQDMSKHFVPCLVFLSGYTRFTDHPISVEFQTELNEIKMLVDDTDSMIKFLFVPIKMDNKYKILCELCSKFDELVNGSCKVDPNYFKFFEFALFAFKIMAGKDDYQYNETHYESVAQFLKDLLNQSVQIEDPEIYEEYEKEMKTCTISLIKLSLFTFEEPQMSEMQLPVLDTLMCWIGYIKTELIHYVRYEKDKDYNMLFKKLGLKYKENQKPLENYLTYRERRMHSPFADTPIELS